MRGVNYKEEAKKMNQTLEPQLRVEQFAELRRRYGVRKMMELMDHRDWDVVFDELRNLKNTLQMIANDDPCGKYGRWAREAMNRPTNDQSAAASG